jgi:hypothetical protein
MLLDFSSLLQRKKITLETFPALFFPPVKEMEEKITLGKLPALFFAFWNPQVSSTSSNVTHHM